MQSKRSDSVDSGSAAFSGTAAAKLLGCSSFTELHLHPPRCEEPWHAELRTSFVTLYMQYLQQPGAGFQQVKVFLATPVSSDSSTNQRYMTTYELFVWFSANNVCYICLSVHYYSLIDCADVFYKVFMLIVFFLFVNSWCTV